MLSGEVGMWYGERLENHMVNRAGDFVYIPANVPHLPYNLSKTEPATAVVARTDPTSRKASSCCRSSTRSTREHSQPAGPSTGPHATLFAALAA